MKKNNFFPIVLLGACLFANTQASAQDSDTPDEEIVITHPLIHGETAYSYAVLDGEELARKLQASIGATVESEPGIRSASFGAAVGRPVVHGLGAARVKVTEDRIDSLDVSVTSTDHAVTVEPFIADKITILKGATNLIYGSGAIGGVVDVETGRIPKKLNGEPVTGRVELRAADNADAETVSFRLDGDLGSSFAWHLDAFSREADDYEIPGFVESPQLIAAEEAEGGDDDGDEEEARDVLEGSSLDVQGGSLGLSFVTDQGFIGLSISRTEAEYGLLAGAHHEEDGDDAEEEEEEGTGFIDLEQTRVDFESEFRFDDSPIEKVNFRLGINDYQHTEFEADGETGTVFDNEAWEARLEISHLEIAGFSGTFGIQLNDREFSADGEEAFVEPVNSDSRAVFWVVERDVDAWHFEAGIRIEDTDYFSTAEEFGAFDEASQSVISISAEGLEERDFSTFSSSFGAVYQINDALALSGLFDYSSRAPTIEELFSNGPHLATQTYEIGDPTLDDESVSALSFSAQYEYAGVNLSATLYYNDFEDFIYEVATGTEEDELPVLLYVQDDATFTGIDLKAEFTLAQFSRGDLGMSLIFDIVDAELDIDGNDNLPRIPSERFGVGLNWISDDWSVNLDWTHVASQTDVAVNELASSSYNDIDFRISRNFKIGDDSLSVFLSGENLTDDDQRNHVSFVKDIAPNIGRRFEVGVRYNF